MSKSKRIEYDKSKGSITRCHCSRCNIETNHEVMMNVRVDDDEDIEGGGYSISWYDDYQIVMCRGCDNISFKHISWFSEDWNPDWNGETCYYYPKRKIRKPIEIRRIPYELESLYIEVIDAYNAGAFILVAGGLRAIIEGICSVKEIDRGKVPVEKNGIIEVVTKKNLEGKIYGLQEGGYISEKQLEVLHELRFLGNISLHEIERPKEEQVNIAFNIIESVLELVFGIEEKSKKLKKYRESRG